MFNLNKIPKDELAALVHIYEEFLIALERHEPTDDIDEAYSFLCKELNEQWEATKSPDSKMSNDEAMEVLVKNAGACIVAWWIWDAERNKNVRPEQNT